MPRRTVRDNNAHNLATRLRELRKARGWTQAELAQRVGVERAIIGNYELGLHYPPVPTLVKLAQVLEVSVDGVLGLHAHRPPEIHDCGLYEMFLSVDSADAATQGLVKQLLDKVLGGTIHTHHRTGTSG